MSLRNTIKYFVQAQYPHHTWERESVITFNRHYNACFNMTLDQIEMLVLRIQYIWGDDLTNTWGVEHLLWTLTYLKSYPTFDNLQCILGRDKKTINKWVLYTVDLIAEINMVSSLHKNVY